MHQPLEEEELSPFEEKLLNYPVGRDIRVLLKRLEEQVNQPGNIHMAPINNYTERLLERISDIAFRKEIRLKIELLLKTAQEDTDTKP